MDAMTIYCISYRRGGLAVIVGKGEHRARVLARIWDPVNGEMPRYLADQWSELVSHTIGERVNLTDIEIEEVRGKTYWAIEFGVEYENGKEVA